MRLPQSQMTHTPTSVMEDSPEDEEVEKSRSSRSSSRVKPELAGGGFAPSTARLDSYREEERKVSEDSEQHSMVAKRSVRTSVERLESEVHSKKLQAPGPPDLEVGRYVTLEPGAIAVNRGRHHRRSTGREDDDSTVMTNTPTLALMDMSSGSRTLQDQSAYLSSLNSDSPIVATVVEDEPPEAQLKTKQISCGRLLRDRRVLSLLCICVLAIIGIAVGLSLSNAREGGAPSILEMGPPTAHPTSPPTSLSLQQFLSSISFDGGAALRNATSPQRRAMQTLEQLPEAFTELGEFVVKQKYASQVLRYGILDTSGVDIVNPTRNKTLQSEELDECSWPFFECNPFDQVVLVEINQLDLSFTLPDELAFFSQLEKLVLPGNNGYGTLPSALGALSLMSELLLSENGFTGTIPKEIASMARLENLQFAGCALKGAIPEEFGRSSTLWNLDLGNNQLTGSIPSAMFRNPTLAFLKLHDNALQGSIPSEIGRSRNIREISVRMNALTGTLPTSIGDLAELGVFDVSLNKLNGTIPARFEKLTLLYEFDLSENELTGQIPLGMTLLPELTGEFRLNDNHLSGTIPTEMGRLRQLTGLALGHNDLSGTIPTQLGLLTSLAEDLDLHDNNLWGTIPSEIGKLTLLGKILLQSNSGLSGTIPTEFGGLSLLHTLKLFETNVNGSLPYGLCELKEQGTLSTLTVSCALECACCDGFCA